MKKKSFLLLLLAFIWSVNINAQVQIGENIFFGEINSENFGTSVSTSSDGSRVVTSYVGPNGYNQINEVRVFEYINGSWIQLGQTIYGDISGDGFGASVTMSGDGSRIAVYSNKTAEISYSYGHVRIYQFNGTEWIQLGSIISGENSTDISGSSMSFSSDGLIIALGAPNKKDENGKNVGYTRVYRFVNNEWQQIGQNIIGGVDFIGNGDKLGESVSISSDGYRLAVGGSGHYRGIGVVRVFNYNESTNIWEQLGSDIVGERIGDYSGSSVSVSNDGLTVAIGAYGNDENGYTSSGQTRIYKYNNSNWVQVGQDIDGEKSNHAFGTSVSLSGDGKEFVSGVTLSRSSSGFIKIYKYSEPDGGWVKFNDIINNSGQSSQSISLSKDGTTLIFQNRIGAQYVNQVYKVNFNEISGKISADFGNNGCFSESIPLDSIKVSAIKGNEMISTYTDVDGSYSLLTSSGNYSVSMDSQNKFDYLDFTDTKEVSFEDFGNIEALNFCLTSNITIENELNVDAVGFPTTRSLSFNKDGSVIAVGVSNRESFTGPGYVEVYDYINNEFIKKGETFIGESDDDWFGSSISLSDSGDRLAIGAPHNYGKTVTGYPPSNGEGGEVKVFDYNNGTWVQVGQDILGASEDNLGYSVSLSADGSRVAVGIPEFISVGGRSGRVEIYELENGGWIQIGNPIRNGTSIEAHSGARISFSADGNHIAIGESGTAAGAVSNKVGVYEYNEGIGDWIQMGNNVNGDTEWDFAGANVSLSKNGNILAISASATNGTENFNYVRVLKYDGNDWVQRDSDFANSGAGVLSDEGNRIIVNSKINDNTPNNDYTQVYDYNGLYWEPFGIEIASNDGYANPDVIELSGDGTRLATNYYQSQKIYLYDIGGNAITGFVSFDSQNNSCTDFGIPARNLKMNTTVGGIKTTSFTNEVGFYKFYIKKDGIYNVQVEDSRFNMSPNFSELQFIGVEGKKAANFCVSANTIENDVSVTLLPVTEARPGFNTVYQIIYENIGTTVSDGNLTFQFNNILQSFVGSTKSPDIQTVNMLTYNYSNLLPFESRTINITLNTEPPSTVNSGDMLPLSAIITPDETDINTSNNTFEFNQRVVNSFDPNDKQVLQGSKITIDEVGEYLHYIIRFQNNGTASAINVRIRDLLADKLDWDSFIPVSSSHSYLTQLSEGNLVDFIFENILLPAQQDDEPNSHGFIAFKIKPKNNVQIGDIITGEANIYFDYNSPITTNTVNTEIVDNSLSVVKNQPENYFWIYPNPTNDMVYLFSETGIVIEKIKVYSVSGKLLLENKFAANEIDLKSFPKGMYFLNIVSDKGSVTKKIIKK